MKYLLILFFLGCLSVKTINLQEHSFNEVPKNIIWYQVAGLSPEHLALIKFDNVEVLNLEGATCIGQMWTYNAYKLRPRPEESFLAQITGKNNIKGGCEDYLNKPVWYFLKDRGFETKILEYGATVRASLDKAFECPENNEFKNITFFSLGPESKPFFKVDLLSQEPIGQGRYHLICDSCNQDLFPIFNNLLSKFSSEKKYNLFILRDFSFKKFLESGDFKSARSFLKELEKSYKLNQKLDNLIIVSSSGMSKEDLPSEGTKWMEFEKTGKNAVYKNDSLLSWVIAQGPSSEKFCGIFPEADLMNRILSDPTKKFKRFLFW